MVEDLALERVAGAGLDGAGARRVVGLDQLPDGAGRVVAVRGRDVAVGEDGVVGDLAADPVCQLGNLALGGDSIFGSDIVERLAYAPRELLF